MNSQTNFFLSILAKFGWLGNWLFFLIALVECLPIVGGFFPGGTLISIAAFFASQGYFNVLDVLLFSALGAIIGDYSGYSLGRFGSDWLLRKKFIKPEFMARGENFFKKYGAPSIFWGRFIGATRAVVPFIAGSAQMRQRNFLFWNIISALSWSIFNVGVGYFAGSLIAAIIKKWSQRLGLILIIIIAALLLYWFIKKHGQNLWQYFKKQSQIFTEKLFGNSWFIKLTARYSIIAEFFQTPFSWERIFGGFLGTVILIILYVITLILDIF